MSGALSCGYCPSIIRSREQRRLAQFPSMRGRELYRHLARAPLSYREDPARSREGSHKTLVSADYPDLHLAFHDRAEIAPGLVRKILTRDVGLSQEEALMHLRGDL
jgi:predicted RNA binding protein YcfA (HicA-like mRNA interferase family)